MAVSIGTSTNANDLYADLLDFLQNDAALTGAVPSQAWVNVWEHASGPESGIVLRGPGLSDQDQVYVGLALINSAPGDSWRMDLWGMTGIINSAVVMTEHINVSHRVSCFFDVNVMDRWFVASGRRFMVVAKMSTVFEACYAGLFLPYGDPTQYPYPLFVGATTSDLNTGGNFDTTWRSTAGGHQHFPYGAFQNSSTDYFATAMMLDPMGVWKDIAGQAGDASSSVVMAPRDFGPDDLFGYGVITTFGAGGVTQLGYETFRYNMGPNIDGTYSLLPFTMIQWSPERQVFGVLDGAYNCPGVGNAAENLITVSTVDHLVVQNVFRTGTGEYWAMKLE